MKGISFIEQHVEKLVVALLGVVLLAVLAMQFLTAPNRVPMGGEEVDPSEIEGRLRAKADVIRGRLAGGGSEEPLVEGGIPKVADDFLAGLDRPVSPRGQLPQIDHALASALLPGDVSSGDAIYHVPSFAPLAMREVREETATIKESVIAASAELREMLSVTAGPADVTWAIPVAEVNLKGLRSELRAAKDGSTPIPELWYNGNLYLVDLVFERQELGENGWSEAVTVPPLPGNFSLRKELAKPDAELRDEVFRLLASRDRWLAILQPEFYETVREVFNSGSISGDTMAVDASESDEVRRIRNSLTANNRKYAKLEATLKELGGPLRGPDDKDPTKGGDNDRKDQSGSGGGTKSPGSGMGFGSGTAGGKRGLSGSAADDEATRAKRRSYTNQLDRLAADIDRLNKQLQKLVPDASAITKVDDDADLSKADSKLVWGHDLGVKRGMTYRYRARLDIYNPFFARKRQLAASQGALADAFTLRTEVSDWSDPVTIEPEVAFFLVDAAPGEGRLGLGAAKFEVFVYRDGERRRETFMVQPGERIGSERDSGRNRESFDFGTDWFVVDVVEGLPGEGRAESKGRNARVLVADDQGRTIFRIAASDADHPIRRKFNDEVEEARAEAEASDEVAPPPAGSASPPQGPGGGPGAPKAN